MNTQSIDYEKLLRIEWDDFCGRNKPTVTFCEQVYKKILTCYGEKHRTYHGIKHPVLLFGALRDIRRECPQLFRNKDFNAGLDVAVFAHDIIYNPRADKGQNERQSAELAFSFAVDMGFPREVARYAKELTLATTHDFIPTKIEEQVMVDVDLSLLGIEWEEFAKNSVEIRLEYAHVPTEKFSAGSKIFLGGMLPPNRTHIYSTEYFSLKLEEKAQSNLRRALTYQFAD